MLSEGVNPIDVLKLYVDPFFEALPSLKAIGWTQYINEDDIWDLSSIRYFWDENVPVGEHYNGAFGLKMHLVRASETASIHSKIVVERFPGITVDICNELHDIETRLTRFLINQESFIVDNLGSVTVAFHCDGTVDNSMLHSEDQEDYPDDDDSNPF